MNGDPSEILLADTDDSASSVVMAGLQDQIDQLTAALTAQQRDLDTQRREIRRLRDQIERG